MEQEHHRALALAACTEEERQQAMARFAVLQPHLNEGVLVAEAARHAGVPLRSVQRWLARYRAAGLVGLVRATRSDMASESSLRNSWRWSRAWRCANRVRPLPPCIGA